MKKWMKRIRRVYDFIFHEESIASYVAFIVLSFLFLKFIFYPIFLYVFNLTDVVAVLSGSMRHEKGIVENNFYNWLKINNFSKEEIANWPFPNGLNIGDAVFVKKVNEDEIKVGDVIVYKNPISGEPIIHRVIKIEKRDSEIYLTTKGDANPISMSFEYNVSFSRIVGKASFRIPYIGYPRTIVYYIFGI
ncbi:MAG: signal peptidase I [Candidatus Parvarchaeota archaeon]|nr:signal peptidase I [Candidatus Jingweiarchaeum tengchongense]MCW1297926.1 signal peptidase I [Candidatus Jingweiarchaeum tengchongense]MCW1300645.1 signal peptidase I [Candidatus Jingweiarchaeum tengchongense]MCW1304636.1 signal peptidase I [Candidatus Jingweiarchaeum tengchongense]MCW1305653.1 signal peptidase I [Candidatus Jingweiarchaeum tengchongense]